MINFFRKIRQKLLSDGKIWKYLTYAIGEIILVVIGILIALQINNWNENRKNRAFEIFTLKEVQNNLKNDSIQIHDILVNRIKVANSLKNMSTNDLHTMPLEQLAKDIAHLWGFDRFFPNRNGYEALKSRGFQVSNPELRSALGKYYENDLLRVSASIYDLEVAFSNDFTPLIQKGYFGIRDSEQALELINPKNEDLHKDLIQYVTTFSPNHRASVKNITEFSEINKELLTFLSISLKELNNTK